MSQILDTVVEQIQVVTELRPRIYHCFMATGHALSFIQPYQEPGDVLCGHIPSSVPWQPCVQGLFLCHYCSII